MGIINKQKGFTIIEVSLFVAVAGLLLMGVMAGITTAINQQRFHDTVNNTQSIIQEQFSEVQSVSNTSETLNQCGGSVGGSTNCSLIGRLIDLGKSGGEGDGSVITAYDIVINSELPPPQDLTTTPLIDVLNNNDVRVIDNANKQASPIDWGGILQKKNSESYSRYIAIIQNPITGDTRIYTVNFGENDDLVFDINGVMTLKNELQDNYTPTSTCIISQDIISLKGTLLITQGGSPATVTVDYKGEDC